MKDEKEPPDEPTQLRELLFHWNNPLRAVRLLAWLLARLLRGDRAGPPPWREAPFVRPDTDKN